MSEIFKFQRQGGMDEEGGIIGSYVATGIVPACHEHLRQRGGLNLPFDIFNDVGK